MITNIKQIVLASFLIMILCFNCSTSKKAQNELNVTGKWIITDIESMGSFNGDGQKLKNINILGVTLWNNSKGKYFQFFSNQILKTNILDEFETNEKILSSFEIDSTKKNMKINFETNKVDFSFEVKFELQSKQMIWILDDILKLSFSKED